MLRIHFWGATGTVTGSKFMVEAGVKLDDRMMIDCGMFQGLKKLRLRNWEGLPEPASSIGSIALTHAHIDHSGYLPRVVKDGFAGPIQCNETTERLLEYLLLDAAHLQEEEAAYANKKGYSRHRPAKPLYNMSDARRAIGLIRSSPMWRDVEVSPNLSVRFNYAGHILGACSLGVTAKTPSGPVSIMFSGDLGRYGAPLLPDPDQPRPTDYLVVESTYGDRLHPGDDPMDELARIVNESLQRGGVLLIPAFAVGRTQRILFDLRQLEEQERIPKIPVYLDSPMASMVTKLQSERIEDLDAEARELFRQNPGRLFPKRMKIVNSRQESMSLNPIRSNAIIVSASGMLSGGRVLHHARQRLPHASNTLLFVGYQAAGTRGRAMLQGLESIKMFGRHVPVNAKIEMVSGYSGHADQGEILTWLKRFPAPPKRTFLVHGEPKSTQALADIIQRELGWQVTIPEYLGAEELT